MAFRETINSIINDYDYDYNLHKCTRRDYITLTLIVKVEKYNLNKKPILIGFNIIKKEIENTISIMTRKIKINVIAQIIFSYKI